MFPKEDLLITLTKSANNRALCILQLPVFYDGRIFKISKGTRFLSFALSFKDQLGFADHFAHFIHYVAVLVAADFVWESDSTVCRKHLIIL
jgi:hypothetical protein